MNEAQDGHARSVAFGRRYVLAAAVLWSLSGVISKPLALDGPTIAFYRSFFAGLSLLPLVPRSRWRFQPVMILCSLVFGAMIGLYLASLKATTAANAIFLQCTAPFWMVPMSALILHERPDRRSLLGIAFAAPGIAAILLFGHDGQPAEGRGVALGLASGVCYAGVVIGMRGMRQLDSIWLSIVNNLGGSLALGAWLVMATGGITVPSPTQTGVLIAFGIIQMAIPYALFARGLRSIGAPEAGLIALLEPILNPIWVFLAHGERPKIATVFGGAFLLAGVLCQYLPGNKRLLKRTNSPPHEAAFNSGDSAPIP